MPVYNGQPYLAEAIESVLRQSFRDFEFVIVDDGSTDDSPTVLQQFADADERLRVLTRGNSGIVNALNEGVAAARGSYIARMDADDIALPDRLQKQLAYMQRSPDCVAVGSAMLNIDPQGRPIAVQRYPQSHDEIQRQLLRGIGGISHPTSMIRAEAMQQVGGYRLKYQWVEDKDLWLRLTEIGRLSNLEDVLLQYRLHLESVCYRRNLEQSRLMRRLLSEFQHRHGSTTADGTFTEPSPPGVAEADTTARTPAQVHAHWSSWALQEGNFGTATRHAWSAITESPWSFDYWPLLVRCLLRIRQPTGLLRPLRRRLVRPE